MAAAPGNVDVAPGNQTQVMLEATRTCPSQALVLDEQTVELELQHAPDLSVAVPGQIVFPQQTCATQPRLSMQVTVGISVPGDYNGTELSELRATIRPISGSSAVGSPGEQASVIFVVAVERQGLEAVASAESASDLEAPFVPAALLAAGLALAAFLLRRR